MNVDPNEIQKFEAYEEPPPGEAPAATPAAMKGTPPIPPVAVRGGGTIGQSRSPNAGAGEGGGGGSPAAKRARMEMMEAAVKMEVAMRR